MAGPIFSIFGVESLWCNRYDIMVWVLFRCTDTKSLSEAVSQRGQTRHKYQELVNKKELKTPHTICRAAQREATHRPVACLSQCLVRFLPHK